jgi:phosphoribosylformimino-5-aminoimidazole carboxamide ribotide isomerase
VQTDFAANLAASLGADRIVAGIDTKNGHIAVRGWKAEVALTPDNAIPQLEPYVHGFLYTHVDGEGLMRGFPLTVAERLRSITTRQLIVAGGIRTRQEIDDLDAMRVDTVVGMAIYTESLQV